MQKALDTAPEITTHHVGEHLARGITLHEQIAAELPRDDRDRSALARLQRSEHVQFQAATELAHQVRDAIRALGLTARGAFVLAYIAPCLLRTPEDRPCPEGWRVVELRNQGHTALNGRWWVCDEAFPNLELRFASGGRS